MTEKCPTLTPNPNPNIHRYETPKKSSTLLPTSTMTASGEAPCESTGCKVSVLSVFFVALQLAGMIVPVRG